MRVLLVLLLSACAPVEPAEPVDLVDSAAWTAVPAAEDPFGSPPTPGCDPEAAVAIEDEQIEIQTDRCGWVTLQQPALVDVGPEHAVELLLFQGALASLEEGAVATLALRLGSSSFWQTEVPIPAEAELHEVIDEGFSLSAGDPVLLHVSNHGQNSYRLDHLWVRR